MDLRKLRKKNKRAAKKAGRADDTERDVDDREAGPVTSAAMPPPAVSAAPAAAASVPSTVGPARAAAPAAVAAAPAADDSPAALEAEREEIAETLFKAALARGELAEALYKAAAARADIAEAREKSASARSIVLEAREKVAAERDTVANARDMAANERDAIANARDRAAAERDKSAIERDSTLIRRLGPTSSRGPDPIAEADAELEKARLEAELQRAHLDALTGAFRREMGRLALRNEIDRARRGDGNFVIAFLDVDGLKGVNDREGHAAGDRILRTLVATMRANLRSYDPIVRFGGDEFIFGVASIDPSEVEHRVGVIDQSLRAATGVGVTAGLATLGPGESLDDLTARADEALIEAKRNRSLQEPTE